MNLAVNPIINQSNQATFKGEWDKTDNGTPYYKSSSATIAGGFMAIPAALWRLRNLSINTDKEALLKKIDKEKSNIMKNFGFLGEDFIKEYNEEHAKQLKNIDKVVNNLKYKKNMAIPFALIAAGLTVGCGILVDNLRNKKAQEMADFVKQNGIKKTFMEQDRVAISNKGRTYYVSNQGRKWGALLGAGCGLTSALMSQGKNAKLKTVLVPIIGFALGGQIMGAIADSNTNKNARIHS